MIDQYKLITVNHKVLNTEDLQHFILRYNNDDEAVERLNVLKKAFGQDEVLYLNTCNRVIYFFYGKEELSSSQFCDFFNHINPDLGITQLANLPQIVEYYSGPRAIHHLYDVASSIDSLVVGEREIFRQFRESYEFAKNHDLCGDNIRLANQSIVKAAKDVYTNTAIGAKPVSVVSLSIQEFLKKGVNKDARILLLGAGETNSTVGRFLRKHQYHNIVIFNRSLDNAKKLSEELDAEARYLGTLKEYSEGFDCIFACTAAQDPIVTMEIYDKINQGDDRKLLVDLSIPNNIAKEVARLDSVDYISIDSIRALAAENMKFRSSNVAAARIILNTHLKDFGLLYEQRRMERAMSHLPKEMSKVKDRALNLVYKDQIASLPPEAQELIAEIANYMEKKCIAVPMKMAKEMAG